MSKLRSKLFIVMMSAMLLVTAAGCGSDNMIGNMLSSMSEDEAQRGKGINSDLKDPVYTYEAVVNAAPGVVHQRKVPYGFYSQKGGDDEYEIWSSHVIKQFKDVKPVPDDASEAEINRLFNQILYVSALDYEPVEELDRYAYLVFQKDRIHPFTKQPIKENAQLNLEIVLDASGSMVNEIKGQSMMDIAKNSINEILATLPDNANVGLRVFGHLGDNTAEKRTESCGANELLQPITKLDREKIKSSMTPIQPTGWTSVAKSIEKGASDLSQFTGEKDVNILYIITDGIETCDGDPVAEAEKLKGGKTNVILGIIGLNVDANQDALLRQIAEAGGGYYASANEADTLTSELYRIHELANAQYEWQTLNDEVLNRLKASHASGRLYNGFLAGQALSERINIGSTIECLQSDDLKIIKPFGNVYKALDKKAGERQKIIEKLLEDKLAEVEKADAEYIKSVAGRKGETVAYMPSTSRVDKFSRYYIKREERPDTTAAQQKDGQKLEEKRQPDK
ncbi:VWA domain-containing protein [Veillonella rodentium]|uniref:von Willebrand factor type A domain n=1 Tax=Veillonella rodentium TaxID=248315 RepID=A0A239ZJH9_9FIRM|nr:VWA domain-containing protein [Veillonella rodentium]SNV71040.1 von Willebrand factor type A domain [Veillonella rodentium]